MYCRKCKQETPDDGKYCINCGIKTAVEIGEKTRGNGQGSAVKRGKTWVAVWTDGHYIGDDGKLHWKRRWKGGFKSKTAALTYAASPPDNELERLPPLSMYWNSWSNSKMLDLSESKQGAYERGWKRLSMIADKLMSEITIEDIQLCVDNNADTFYTARDMKTVLSHCFKRAVAEGNARTNLADFISLPKLNESEMRPFEETEISNLWEAYGNGHKFIGYVLLMIYTGMMPGELLRLEVNMINYETHEIIGCGLKTKKRKNTPVVFPEMITPVLIDICNGLTNNEKVVNVSKDKFYKEYHKELIYANVRDLPPYSCRHTTATALALGNIAPSVIQEVMRHTKFSTTQRYIHPNVNSARDAVNTLGSGKKTVAKKV